MKHFVAIIVALIMMPSLQAQTGGAPRSYRITPPLRVAARPVDGMAPRGVTQADPFKPREEKEHPTTLAVQGYCLVSLRDQQHWVQGSPHIQAIMGGKVYLFSSVRARDIFLAAPHLYMPALDGDCMVTFAESGRRVSGQLEYGLVHANRVYFFAHRAQLHSFQSAPDEYVNADLVDDGACIVTKVTENRYVPGIPATVAMMDGRRYFFASAYQRRIFEQKPSEFLVKPLRNPLAASGLEVPEFADSLEIESMRVDGEGPRLSGRRASPFSPTVPRPTTKRASESDEESEGLEGYGHSRAMSGYCPVTIRTQNTWRRGKAKFRHTFDGKVYFLAGPEELAAFQADPVSYAPVLSGDSVVASVTDFERVAGSVFHAFIYKERLYLFANEEERIAFREDPAKFDDADLAAQGTCMVSRVDDKQEVPGVAEYETLYLGKRYRFISAEYLKKFLADPKLYAEE